MSSRARALQPRRGAYSCSDVLFLLLGERYVGVLGVAVEGCSEASVVWAAQARTSNVLLEAAQDGGAQKCAESGAEETAAHQRTGLQTVPSNTICIQPKEERVVLRPVSEQTGCEPLVGRLVVHACAVPGGLVAVVQCEA